MSQGDIIPMLIGVSLALVLTFLVGGTPLLFLDYYRGAKARRGWRRAADRWGLELTIPWLLFRRWTLNGKVGEFEVSCRSDSRRTRVEVGPVDPSFTIAAEGLAGFFSSIETSGDAEFDKRVRASGLPLALAAALDTDARKWLIEATALGVRVGEGRVLLDRAAKDHTPELETVLNAMLQVARATRILNRAEQIEAAGRNARTDLVPRVRRSCLLALIEQAPGTPQLAEAAQDALARTDPNLHALGLAVHGSLQQQQEMVGKVVPEVEAALLARMAANGAGEEVFLARLPATEGAARAAVAEILGRIGTAAAVPPLRAASPGLLGDGTLRRTIDAAIHSIQGRLQDAGTGQLSVPADNHGRAGALSPAESAGALSMQPAVNRPTTSK